MDGTPFSGDSTAKRLKAGEILESNGYESLGKETMISGATGRPLQAKMFIGVCSYRKFYDFFFACACRMFSLLVSSSKLST